MPYKIPLAHIRKHHALLRFHSSCHYKGKGNEAVGSPSASSIGRRFGTIKQGTFRVEDDPLDFDNPLLALADIVMEQP